MPSGKTPDDKAPAQAEISALTPAATTAVPTERAQFKSLLLGNPNYFGSFPKLGGIVVLPKKYDVAWEELTCLGLEPSQERLEAVVNIKQHAGYNGNACSQGSHEYVRFFVERNGVWQDLGSVAIQVYDLANTPLPLSYCASVDFDEARKLCNTENILNVRAILSWNLEPPAGDPNFTPPFGNVLDARVQVARLLLHEVPIGHLMANGTLTLKAEALPGLDPTQTLKAQEPQPLSYTELKALYANATVPGHRFGFAEAQTLMQKPALGTLTPAKTATLAAGAELGAILAAIQKQSGDTSFEQLLCAGYNPQTRELEAVIEIKRNAGYSGGLCTAGSTEYVGFYAFLNGAWQSLGTGAVQVHDLAAVTPGHPLMYAAYRISGLTEMACQNLTGVPLRAILSWQAQPTGPDYVPVWGNAVNTHVQPMIGETEPGEHIRLMRLGSVTVSGIGSSTGLANPTGIAGDCVGYDSPFGGEIIVEGDFTPKIDVFNHATGAVLAGAKPIIYQVWVTRKDVPSAPFQLTNAFGIALFPPNAVFPPLYFTQSVQAAPGAVPTGVSGTLYYQYMESDLQAVNPRTLAAFEAGGLTEGNYYVEIRGWYWDGAAAAYAPMASQGQLIHVYNGYPHLELGSTVRRPQVAISLTSMADCGNVKVGDTITGKYSVVDNFFGYLSIALVPITIGGVAQPENIVSLAPPTTPPHDTISYNGANTSGSQGTFTLDTSKMTPCGYSIQLYAEDRALVDSHCYHHWNEIAVGFCLIAK
jgi:hypothetical protein